MRKILIQFLIIAFCFWHMASVALYALPPNAHDFLTAYLNEKVRPSVRPYMLLTSQWQRWNLFSPDPLRRMLEVTVYADSGAGMTPRMHITPNTIPWVRRSPELKILRRMEEENTSVNVKQRYAQLYCAPLELAPGTPVQLKKRVAIIPQNSSPQRIGWWKAWQPQWGMEEVFIETRCPTEA